jgi:phosphoglycerol transferase MdoB-like AlkP superfamily enzyme
MAACRRPPAGPYDLAFALDVSPPRLVESSRELSVPLALTNIGRRSWDPERVHVSYHWLEFVPREILSRSRWDVPYHDGIRTDLPAAIAPGGRAQVEGRVLPLDMPGLYWLQWDMVEEGVTWFAQVSPRQTRTLVVVRPPVAWLAAPMPFVIVLFALFAPRRRMAAIGDVVWCAAVLALKPLVVVHDALLEPTAVAYWLAAAAALVPVALALLLPRRARVWTLVAVGAFGSLLVLGDVVYYRFFGDVLSAPAVLAARQTGHVWGSVRSLLSPILIWIVVDVPLAAWLAVRLSRIDCAEPALRRRAAAMAAIVVPLAVVGLPLSVTRELAATPLDQMFRDRAVVERLGLFGFHAYDGWNYVRSTWLRTPVTDGERQVVQAWFAARAPQRSGPASPSFGVARGRNLIVVQVESLQDYVVDFRAGGEDVMPHLKTWSRQGLRFTNVTDETSEGRTSDAEFTTMASLLPLEHGAVAFRFPGNHYAALPSVLAEHGYTTLSAVPFEPGFWNRQVMHPSYGFKQSLFEPDFTMTDQIGWGLNDREFLRQMVPRLERLPQPFAAWLITLSLHHPFDDFPDRHKVLKLGAIERTSFGNYLHTMRFFDDALDAFMTALARDGLLDSSVVVVFGDHDAGFVRTTALSRAIGIRDDDVAWALNDRVPLFIRVPGAAAVGLQGMRDVPAGQTDFAPTVLSLLGVDAAGLPYVGRNLLGAPDDAPVPRPYGEWIDRHHFSFTRGPMPACHDLDGKPATTGACADAGREARRTRDMSRLVVTGDLQQRLRAHLAGAQR